MRINLSRRATRRAGAAVAVATLILTLGACGGGSSSSTATTDTTETTTSTPPPTFSADKEAAFLAASKDPRAGKLADLPDSVKLAAARSACQDLAAGKTGKQVVDDFNSTDDTKSGIEANGFIVGAAVGAMCPDQTEQAKKG